MKNQSRKGFSLLELLIVVAIILVIAAIAIPNFLKASKAAKQVAAVGSARTLVSAQLTYQQLYPTTGYATDLAFLGAGTAQTIAPDSSANANILPIGWKNTFVQNGYTYDATGSTVTDFLVTAVPTDNTFNGYCGASDNAVHLVAPGATAPATGAACKALPVIQ